jgi:hypothetical protein
MVLFLGGGVLGVSHITLARQVLLKVLEQSMRWAVMVGVRGPS